MTYRRGLQILSSRVKLLEKSGVQSLTAAFRAALVAPFSSILNCNRARVGREVTL
jgi:hypothetical protein